MSLLETIRRAVSAAPAAETALADLEPNPAQAGDEPRPGVETEKVTMTILTPAAGAAITAGISEADLSAAVAAAVANGHEAGAKAANDRIGAVLGAEGIKGDGKRMSAALDLAQKSPGMSAEDVVGFVTGNVGAAATTIAPAPAATYEQQRLASAALTQTGAAQPQKSGLSAAVDRQIETLKR